jgi:hypothetical protein
MLFSEFKNALEREIFKYGFIAHPLTYTEIEECFDRNMSVVEAYNCACDVYAGVQFYDALIANRGSH